MADDIYSELGSRVRTRRQQLGWTLERLGEASGLHPSFIGQIERGSKKASLKTLATLAQALDTTPGRLLDEPQPRPQASWRDKIDALLRDASSDQREILYSTLQHLSRELREKRPPR